MCLLGSPIISILKTFTWYSSVALLSPTCSLYGYKKKLIFTPCKQQEEQAEKVGPTALIYDDNERGTDCSLPSFYVPS